MPVNPQVKNAFDALQSKVDARVQAEVQQFTDAINAAGATAAATIDELKAQVATLQAEADPSDTVNTIVELTDRLDQEIDSIVPNPAPPPPPPTPEGGARGGASGARR